MLEIDILGIFFILGRILFGGYFLLLGSLKVYRLLKGFRSTGFYFEFRNLYIILIGFLVGLGGLGIILGLLVDVCISILILYLVIESFSQYKFWKNQLPLPLKKDLFWNFSKNLALIGALFMMLTLATFWPFSLGIGF